MALITHDDYLRVGMRWKDAFGSDHVNVWYFNVIEVPIPHPGNAALLQAFTDTLINQWYSSGLSLRLDNDANFADCKFDRVVVVNGQIRTAESFGLYVPTGALPGGNSSDPLPPGAAIVGLLRTSGVKTLGRKFIGMLCESDHSAAGFASTLVTPVLTYLAGFLSVMTPTPAFRVQAQAYSKRAAAWLNFISCAVSTYAGYQRRRRQRVGS
jgi:hypothetical protein